MSQRRVLLQRRLPPLPPIPRQPEEEIQVTYEEIAGEIPADEKPTVKPPPSQAESLIRTTANAEPLLTYDRERRDWVLARPYTARQRETRTGNTWIVPCRVGLPVNVSFVIEPMALRAEIVRTALDQDRTIAMIHMVGKPFPDYVGRRLTDQHVRDICDLFYRADLTGTDRG